MKRSSKRCFQSNCYAVAPFASPANPTVHACEEHKKRDFVNMRNKRCLAPGCYRNPHYGVSRAVDPNSKAQFCTLHKAPGMENVNGGRCAGPDCSKQPRFALPGNKGKFCSKHREEGMVDVLYTPCATPGCMKHPHFGHTDGGPRYCAQHRAEGMVDVKHRRCAVKGCRKDRLQIPGPRKRSKFCEIHHYTEAEEELVYGSASAGRAAEQSISPSAGPPRPPTPTNPPFLKRPASSSAMSEYSGSRDKRGRMMSIAERESAGGVPVTQDDGSFPQASEPRLRIPGDAQFAGGPGEQKCLPGFLATVGRALPEVAWVGGAVAPSESSPRFKSAPFATCYSPGMTTITTSTQSDQAFVETARRSQTQSGYRSAGGQALTALEPGDANPYPLFSREGTHSHNSDDRSRSEGGSGGRASGVDGRIPWASSAVSRQALPYQLPPIATDMATGIRPFRLPTWKPAAALVADQVSWYRSSAWGFPSGSRAGSVGGDGSWGGYGSRDVGVGAAGRGMVMRESSSRPPAVM